MTESTTADRLVRQEVYLCLSSLVSTLANGYGSGADNERGDLAELCEQAFELSTSVPDFEEAVRWHVNHDMDRDEVVTYLTGRSIECRDEEDIGTLRDALLSDLEEEDAWQIFAGDNRVDPYEREVFEHWSVSNWLADKLEAHGEKVVRDFANMNVWARCTTGQGLAMDGVFQDIAREIDNKA